MGDGVMEAGSHAGGVVETLLEENQDAVRHMVRAGNASGGKVAAPKAAVPGKKRNPHTGLAAGWGNACTWCAAAEDATRKVDTAIMLARASKEQGQVGKAGSSVAGITRYDSGLGVSRTRWFSVAGLCLCMPTP